MSQVNPDADLEKAITEVAHNLTDTCRSTIALLLIQGFPERNGIVKAFKKLRIDTAIKILRSQGQIIGGDVTNMILGILDEGRLANIRSILLRYQALFLDKEGNLGEFVTLWNKCKEKMPNLNLTFVFKQKDREGDLYRRVKDYIEGRIPIPVPEKKEEPKPVPVEAPKPKLLSADEFMKQLPLSLNDAITTALGKLTPKTIHTFYRITNPKVVDDAYPTSLYSYLQAIKNIRDEYECDRFIRYYKKKHLIEEGFEFDISQLILLICKEESLQETTKILLEYQSQFINPNFAACCSLCRTYVKKRVCELFVTLPDVYHKIFYYAFKEDYEKQGKPYGEAECYLEIRKLFGIEDLIKKSFEIEEKKKEQVPVKTQINSSKPKTETNQSDECVICMDGKKQYAANPCGHLGLCGDCISNVSFCPICKKEAISFIKIFNV